MAFWERMQLHVSSHSPVEAMSLLGVGATLPAATHTFTQWLA